jgi:hypothetical protein
MAPILKTTTTAVKAHFRDILSANVGMNIQPTKAPRRSIPVIKLVPNAVVVSGITSWNCGITLIIDITPWSYPKEKPPKEARNAAPDT